MQVQLDRAWFLRHLRTVLTSLYDPSVLRDSPLVALFGLEQRTNRVSALRRSLTDAIEALRPNESTPPGARTWRVYQILRRRYIEQATQRGVASDLGLSVRQLQREEKLARNELADHLWAAYNLEAEQYNLTSTPTEVNDQIPPMDPRTPTHAQELEWLRSSVPPQMTDIGEVIQEILRTIDPLRETLKVSVAYATQKRPPRMLLQVPMLRQALVNIVSAAIHRVPGGQVCIQAEVFPRQVCIHIHAVASHDVSFPQQQEDTESLEMAERLIRLCRGSLEIMPNVDKEPAPSIADEKVFAAKITFAAAEQVRVLVIDDNADTLQLFQRYLSGSRYHFIGAQSAERGLALAEELTPQIIVLDVMMPERDGWTVLGRLREHPELREALIIVCTILPQEDLALTLGAVGFIRKPVSQAELLSVLDRQLDRLAKESG
jgi:CheY-like chemotaxis protein